MPHLPILRNPTASIDKASFYLTTCRCRKIDQLIIFSSFDFSASYSALYLNCCSATCRKNFTIRSSRNEQNDYGNFSLISTGNSISCEDDDRYEVSSSSKALKSAALRQPICGKILFGSKKLRSVIILNIITVVYASNIPVVKEVEAFMDPAAFSAVRFTISAIPFLPFVFQARHDAKIRNAGLELGLWISLGYLIEALGLLTAEAGRASFLSLFTVIVVPFFECMLGAIVPRRTWFGILMSILGIGMLECTGSPPNIGDLLNFLSAIFFGIHTLRTEHLSRTTRDEEFMALLGYEVCVLAVLSTIWYVLGGNFHGSHQAEGDSWTWTLLWDWMVAFPWIPALYTGVFSTGLCLWAEIAAMRDVSATETAVIYGMEPLWGAGFAWFLLGERWSTAGWIGAALMLGGSLLVQTFGSSTSGAADTRGNDKDGDLPFVPDTQKLSLTASPVVVRSKKDVVKL